MSSNSFSLEGKVAVVTGASKGIGRAIALGYAAAGAQIVMASRNRGNLEKASEEASKLGKQPLIAPTDVTQKGDVDNLVRTTLNRFGRIDVMVNDPALTIMKPIMDIEEPEWDSVMDANLKGFYFLSRAAGLVMREKKKGSIINISSNLGYKVSPRMPTYSVAKAGIIMLTKALAVELGPHNVRVNAIAPGLTATEFSLGPQQNEAYRAARAQQIPMRRIAEPEDMVGAAIYLASDASAFVNGHTLVVDGGDLA
ncbi:MAG: glucose 1-dehydrogenase [Chloroflexi bacterium]|nr:glucose 1-dehydrogenase [Chloroflexota bacterium]